MQWISKVLQRTYTILGKYSAKLYKKLYLEEVFEIWRGLEWEMVQEYLPTQPSLHKTHKWGACWKKKIEQKVDRLIDR